MSLIDVALTVMAENRWRAATVAGICTEANLNKRYFYESFGDLDALAAAVIDYVATDVGRAAVAAFDSVDTAPVDVQARTVVDAVVRSVAVDGRRARVLLGGVAWSPEVHEGRNAAMARLADILAVHARLGRSESARYPATSTVVAFLIGGTAQAVLMWIDGGEDGHSTDQLVDDVTALWLSVGASTVDDPHPAPRR